MKYYLDTEFDGLGGDLISLALVREDGASFYVVLTSYAKDPWVRENVCGPMLFPANMPKGIQGWYRDEKERGFKFYMNAGEHIAEFLKGDESPHIVSDWPDDIKYFCQAVITGPGEMVAIPHLTFEVVRVDAYPTSVEGAVQHNAFWDAMALKAKVEAA